jgi:hypothetical protein
MSETPRPLWELAQEWRDIANGYGEAKRKAAIMACAKQLEVLLNVWDGQLKDISYVGEEFDIPVEGNWVRQQLLGVPPKEPATEKK